MRTRKALVAMMAVMVLTLGSARAEIVLEDDFDYGIGTLLSTTPWIQKSNDVAMGSMWDGSTPGEIDLTNQQIDGDTQTGNPTRFYRDFRSPLVAEDIIWRATMAVEYATPNTFVALADQSAGDDALLHGLVLQCNGTAWVLIVQPAITGLGDAVITDGFWPVASSPSWAGKQVAVELHVDATANTVWAELDGNGAHHTSPVVSILDGAETQLNRSVLWMSGVSAPGNGSHGAVIDDHSVELTGSGSLVREWNVDSSGDWNQIANWDVGGAPDANTHTAVFGDKITSARVVYTETSVTAKTIQFDNASSYAVAGHGTVNLEADSGNASVTIAQGDHEFQARVSLTSSTDADVAAGASLTFTNVLTLNGNTLTKTGDGTLSINNKLNAGGGSVVGLAGTIAGDGAIGGDLTNTSATVAPGNSPGTLTVEGNFSQAAGGTLAIELAGTATGEFDVLAVTGSASLGGSLDITELYTPGGADAWTILTAGGGITGAFDTITAGYQVALANGDTELVLSLSGTLLPGDANGDGCVDDLDLTALAVHWQQSTNLWENGDFNGDGIVDDLDLTALAVNWQQGCGGGGIFADAVAASNVPEPASALVLLLGFAGVARRRSRN